MSLKLRFSGLNVGLNCLKVGLANFFERIFRPCFSRISGPPKKIHAQNSRPEIIGIPLQLISLSRTELFSLRFSAYFGDQLLPTSSLVPGTHHCHVCHFAVRLVHVLLCHTLKAHSAATGRSPWAARRPLPCNEWPRKPIPPKYWGWQVHPPNLGGMGCPKSLVLQCFFEGCHRNLGGEMSPPLFWGGMGLQGMATSFKFFSACHS